MTSASFLLVVFRLTSLFRAQSREACYVPQRDTSASMTGDDQLAVRGELRHVNVSVQPWHDDRNLALGKIHKRGHSIRAIRFV
jgi:hypothetical protein